MTRLTDRAPAARDRLITAGAVVLALALAFWQRPGWASSDTKIDLHVDPSRFLTSVASVWTPTTDLGEVHSAQYSGYLWPMGPFFSALHGLGLSPWVVQRLWLALMFALAAWGMLRLLDALAGRPRRILHVVGALVYLLNPYVVVFTARTTITLLGYAALPWLMLVCFHGVRNTKGWRGWWWPAAFALILTSSGGGVNAAVVGWMLVGPLVLLLYGPLTGTIAWRATGAFLARAGGFAVLASLWWIVPLLVHVRFGIDFLQFTEQPASIWGTNSASESLRLMGYWTSYIGVGFGATRPYFSDSPTLLFNPLVVFASLLLPALALTSFARAKRSSPAPLLALLALVGLVIMTAGFPDGTPVRSGMDWVYHHVFVLRFMRTTNKAAPLVAAGFAGLLGIGAESAWGWLRRQGPVPWARALRWLGPAGLAGLLVLAALPLIRGRALDDQLLWHRIPSAWRQAGQGLDRTLPANTRAVVLPGQIYGYYKWGGTIDAILPRLTDRPVAVRYETPYSDLHAVDLLTSTDDLVQQRRLIPGELAPLLRLMGVGAVINGADDDITRSGAIDPAAAAGVLAGQGLGAPSHAYGPVSALPPAAGDLGHRTPEAEVRRYDPAGARPIVHVDPVTNPTVVDGSAASLADLAAFGALPDRQAILYAGDQRTPALRALAAGGANLVIGDSNRRRTFLPESTQQNQGPTLPADAPISSGSAVINPFPALGSADQTVAALQGARYVTAPSTAGELQFPEHAAIAAFDGDPGTDWIADRYLPVADRYIEVGFLAPRDVSEVSLLPLDDAHGTVTQVSVNGVRHAVGPGWTQVPVHLRHVQALRVTITHVDQPRHLLGGAGGFREIRIPGLQIRQPLRVPLVLSRSLAGTDLRHDSLTFTFERVTGDDPFRRNPGTALTVLANPADRGDPEAAIDRIIVSPAARTVHADAWIYPGIQTADSALDQLAGYRGPASFDSSSRFQDQPAFRASRAFAAGRGAGWIGAWLRPEAPAPWIAWRTPAPRTLSTLRILPSPLIVRHPTEVALSWPGGSSGALPVGGDGTVTLPASVRARSFRLTILAAVFGAGATSRQRQARAVGIGRIIVPGLAPPRVPRAGSLRAPCGTVAITVAGRRVPLRPSGTVAMMDAGRPLRADACGAGTTTPLAAGIDAVRALPGPFSIDLLRLRSPAPDPVAVAASAAGALIAPGHIGQSSVSGVRLALRAPAWLVLGESYDRGWQASCDGRSLGAPVVLDGYGNGWRVPAGCTNASFSFGPQAGTKTSYLVSAAVCFALLLLLLFGARRRPATATVEPPGETEPAREARAPRRSVPVALGLAAAGAAVVGTMFAIRAGAVAFPLLAIVVWRGYSPRRLLLAAAGLIGVVVPLIYLLATPAGSAHGYGFTYSTDLITAHWVGVGVFVMLALALAVRLRRPGRRRRSARGPR